VRNQRDFPYRRRVSACKQRSLREVTDGYACSVGPALRSHLRERTARCVFSSPRAVVRALGWRGCATACARDMRAAGRRGSASSCSQAYGLSDAQASGGRRASPWPSRATRRTAAGPRGEPQPEPRQAQEPRQRTLSAIARRVLRRAWLSPAVGHGQVRFAWTCGPRRPGLSCGLAGEPEAYLARASLTPKPMSAAPATRSRPRVTRGLPRSRSASRCVSTTTSAP
jgi:hypothetical protein